MTGNYSNRTVVNTDPYIELDNQGRKEIYLSIFAYNGHSVQYRDFVRMVCAGPYSH